MIRRIRIPAVPRRTVLAAASLVLAAGSSATVLAPQPVVTPAATPALSDRLGPKTWAFALPVAWLAAPLPGLHEDDILDLLGARAGERATASDVATGVRVMSADERTIVIELTADDAAAIAAARARGLSLLPILRSTR